MVNIMENPTKVDDLGVPPFKETPIYLSFLFLFPQHLAMPAS